MVTKPGRSLSKIGWRVPSEDKEDQESATEGTSVLLASGCHDLACLSGFEQARREGGWMKGRGEASS